MSALHASWDYGPSSHVMVTQENQPFTSPFMSSLQASQPFIQQSPYLPNWTKTGDSARERGVWNPSSLVKSQPVSSIADDRWLCPFVLDSGLGKALLWPGLLRTGQVLPCSFTCKIKRYRFCLPSLMKPPIPETQMKVFCQPKGDRAKDWWRAGWGDHMRTMTGSGSPHLAGSGED